MKRYKRKQAKPERIAMWVAAGILILMAFLGTTVWGAPDYALYYFGGDLDSGKIVFYPDTVGAGTNRDSVTVLSGALPVKDSLLLDNDYNWHTYRVYFFAGEDASNPYGYGETVQFRTELVGGDGPTPVVITTHDSVTVANISGVNYTVENGNGDFITGFTFGGVDTVNLTIGTEYFFYGLKQGYYTHPVDSITVADGSTATFNCAVLSATAAAEDSVCAVTINIKSGLGAVLDGIWVTANLSKSFVTDWAGSAIVNRQQRARSDSHGQVVFYCLYSSAIDDTDWVFATEGIGGIRKVYTVASQTTVTVDLSP